jgi:sirohydrochlorin cobaltochelatase
MTGYAVFAHGSPVESANEAVRVMTRALAKRGGFDLMEPSFLESGVPDLPGAVEKLIQSGATHIVVLPYFLTTGIHLKRDLPRIVEELRGIYKDVAFEVRAPLDGHPALLEVLIARAQEESS